MVSELGPRRQAWIQVPPPSPPRTQSKSAGLPARRSGPASYHYSPRNQNSHAVSASSALPRPPRSRMHESTIAEKDSDEESWDHVVDSFDETSETDSEIGIPFYAPSIAPSIAESNNDTVDEKSQTIESPRKLRVESLQPAPGFEVYNIEFSQYLDDEYGTDEVRAEIEHKPISNTTPDKTGPLFRWIHLKQDTMDFDAFQSTAKALPDLTEEESGDIMRLLQRGQKQAQKPFRTKDGPRGRVLGPIVLSKEIPNETLNTEDGYFFYSLPYFCLNKYVELNVPSHSNLQPTRTLLQTRDPSTSKGREFEQAICQLNGISSGHCFHLSTLWCLVIKDKYIMTCSLHSGTELSGELLDILKRPPSQPSAVVRDRPQVLRVILENALYLIPINECDSWFKFTQKFSVLHNEFDDVYTVYLNGRRIESGQWHIVIRQALKLTMQTRVIVSMKPHVLNRPLNKPLLGSDDAAEIAASRPSTPNRGGESTASITGLRKIGSIREEEESPARGRSDDSTARLKAPLSPGLRSPDPLNRLPSTSIISFESYLQDFHALRWIAVKFIDPLDPDTSANSGKDVPKIAHPENNRPRKSYDEKVESYLDELHKYMQVKVGAVSEMKYQNCKAKSSREVEKTLAGIVRGGLDDAKVVHLKQQIVTAAKSILPIFLPLDQRGTIVSKYWGAVHASIVAPMKRNTGQIKQTIDVLMAMARVCIDMQAQLSKGKGPNPTETNLPVEFVRAWLALLTCQLNLTQETVSTARKEALKSQNYLNTAIEVVMTKFEGKTLPKLRALVPSELSVFFIHRVLQDMAGDLPGISSSYWEYFTHLESLIKKDRLNRGHQAKIATFLEELDIIKEQLQEQRNIIIQLKRGPLIERDHEQYPAFSGMYHVKLLEKCTDSVSGTKASLSELQRKTQSLEAASVAYIQSNKEQQERAIYVFTIVTIIFLPISTVSSIFGMNVKDVRNMENGQWVFWVVAIPVTAIVIIGSLFGAGVIPFRGKQSVALPRVPIRPSDRSGYDSNDENELREVRRA